MIQQYLETLVRYLQGGGDYKEFALHLTELKLQTDQLYRRQVQSGLSPRDVLPLPPVSGLLETYERGHLTRETLAVLIHELDRMRQHGESVLAAAFAPAISPPNETWLDRLKAERDQLDERLGKLRQMLKKPTVVLDDRALDLLSEQELHMAGYLGVLDERIARATTTATQP